MKNIYVSLILFLVFLGVVIIIPGAVRHSYSKTGKIVKIPAVTEMTSEEYMRTISLFSGDVIVRVVLDQNHDTVYAIRTPLSQVELKEGELVSVNNFLNGGEYLIE